MSSLKNFDWILFLIVFLILCLGAVTIFSVNPFLFKTQLIYAFFSLGIFFLISSLDFRILMNLSGVFYFITIFLLLLPPFFGVLSRGAVRWIQIGGLTLQPSEIVKPFLIIFFSKFWFRKFNLKNFLSFLFYLLIPTILIFYQPDLGSALVVLSIGLGILFSLDINFKQILILIFEIILIFPLACFFLKDYQRLRLIHFLNPYSDPLGAGYNLIQSIVAVGSGRLKGRGFGRGTQSHLAFLPERHTDFIFASYAEEFGFLGSGLLIFLYFLLLRRILKIAYSTKDEFGYRMVIGVFSFFFFQTGVNIGMNLGILPIAGITLPLFSFGGSSLFSTMISLGLVEGLVISSLSRKAEVEIG